MGSYMLADHDQALIDGQYETHKPKIHGKKLNALIETEGITRVTRDYELFPGIDILGAPEHRDVFISSLVCTINFVRTPVIDTE